MALLWWLAGRLEKTLMSQSLSIICPYYNSPTTIKPMYEAIKEAFEEEDISWKLVLVFDGSPCQGWETIEEISKIDERVVGIKLSHNVGQNLAIKAGLDSSMTDFYAVIDCDFQDNPADIVPLVNNLRNSDCSIVYGKRRKGTDVKMLKNLGRVLFYYIIQYLTNVRVGARDGTFCVFDSKCAEYLQKINSRFQVFAFTIRSIGFKSTEIIVERSPRNSGQSSYNLWDLVRLGVYIIISYSDRIVRLFAIVGGLIFLFSAAAFFFYLFLGVFGVFGVSGFATIVIFLIGFGGLQILLTSFVGLYCARILNETRNDPLYFVEVQTDEEH